MITNSNRYGLTRGSYSSEFLELTDAGNKATNPEIPEADRLKAKFELAIEAAPTFKHLYERNKNNRIPSPEVMRDSLAKLKIDEKHRKGCVEVFLENVKHLGLLRTIAGAERLIPIEQVLEERPSGVEPTEKMGSPLRRDEQLAEPGIKKNWKHMCFFIAPIGNEGTEERKHSDMILESLITRALEGEGFDVIRADRISDPGMISG